LLDAYVGLAALTGDNTLYRRYQQRAEWAANPEERYRFLYALAAFRDAALLQRTLDYAHSDKVRAQDRAILIARVLANPVGRELAWQDVQQHWPQLQAGVGAFGGTTRIIEALGAFCDVSAARDIRAFFDAREVPGAARVVAQTIEDIEACAAIKRSQQPLLDTALAAAR
jgi:aminopeptidase N/puromycin-sensitive aminopeptidase